MAEALIFHYRNADNLLVRLNPNAKLISLIVYTIIVSTSAPAVVFPLVLLPIAAAFMIRLPWREYLRESIFFVVLSLIMFVASVVSDQSLIHALAYSASFLSMVLASILLADTTMPDELARSLGAALSHIFGRYAYALATAMEITLSMIPIIIDSSVSIFEARKARGASFISHPLRSVSELSVSILSDLLDRAEIYIDALYSRGYDASKRRKCAPYRLRDVSVIILSILLFLLHIMASCII